MNVITLISPGAFHVSALLGFHVVARYRRMRSSGKVTISASQPNVIRIPLHNDTRINFVSLRPSNGFERTACDDGFPANGSPICATIIIAFIKNQH